jgi:uncharacterized protein YbjT (DUF2867 family)
MSLNIFVMGANRFLGKELVKSLKRERQNVYAGVRSSKGADELKNLGIKLVYADLNHVESLKIAMRGIDKVFFIPPFVPNMVELSHRFVDVAMKNHIKHIVKLSSVRVNLDTDEFAIARWHRKVEKEIEQSGIPYTFLRSYTFMQNFINFSAPTIQDHGAFYAPMGNGCEPFIDQRDIANVAMHVLTDSKHENKKYNLSGPKALTYFEVADILSHVTEKKIRFVDVPSNSFRQTLQQVRITNEIINTMLDNFEIIKSKKFGYTPEVTHVVEEITGKKAISFETFAKDNQSFFVER